MDNLTHAERKALPITSGVLDYFPDALLEIAKVSRAGNEQHHPGEPLHWDKSKSQDEADALVRHLLDRGRFDTDGQRHTAKVAWRALALLQRELDAEKAMQTIGWTGELIVSNHNLAAVSAEGAFKRVPIIAQSDYERAKAELAELEQKLGKAEALRQALPIPFVPLDDEASPFLPVQEQAPDFYPTFIPMTFSRPPCTTDFSPEYETDGEAVSCAVGSEAEIVSEMATFGEAVHDTPPPPVGDIPIPMTSEDIAVWRDGGPFL